MCRNETKICELLKTVTERNGSEVNELWEEFVKRHKAQREMMLEV